MSRFNPDPDREPGRIYEVADKWRYTALLGERSVFHDEKELWTDGLLDELQSQFRKSPHNSEEAFLQKLETQLSEASPECIQLMAEILWVMLLFPLNIGLDKKRENVCTIWLWSKERLETPHPLLSDTLLMGIGSAGTAYNTHRSRELDFFITALRDFKKLGAADSEQIASDPWKFVEWLSAVKEAKKRQLPHILPHLLFPDTFERISSKGDKSRILAGFDVATKKETEEWTATQISRALLDLREELEQDHGKDIDFYQEEFKLRWKTGTRSWLLSWNPSKWDWGNFAVDRTETMAGKKVDISWKCRAKQPIPGDRVFLVRTGIDPKGIVAAGKITRPPYEAKHWDTARADAGDTTSFVDVAFDSVRDAETDEIVRLKALKDREPDQEWSPQNSGIEIKSQPASTLERLWKKLPHHVAGDTERDSGGATLEKFFRNSGTPLNLILYGPPGTGKTHRLKGYIRGYQASDDFKDPETDRFKFVTFHQNYSYEDFVEGIRPVTENGNVTYEVRPGVLKEICERARKEPDKKFAILIDEINRGNIAKIFGELITLVEVDKRIRTNDSGNRLSNCKGLEVTLPYSGELFGVPANVDVIGTMNTADRSIALLDSALRRRFRFEELTPKPELLESIDDVDGNTIDLQQLLETMNARICHLLHRDQTLGHSYLYNVKSFDELRTVFAREILPFLQEVFYDDWRQIRFVLSDQAVEEEMQLIRKRTGNADDLFPKVDPSEIHFGDVFEVVHEDNITPNAIRKIYEPL